MINQLKYATLSANVPESSGIASQSSGIFRNFSGLGIVLESSGIFQNFPRSSGIIAESFGIFQNFPGLAGKTKSEFVLIIFDLFSCLK